MARKKKTDTPATVITTEGSVNIPTVSFRSVAKKGGMVEALGLLNKMFKDDHRVQMNSRVPIPHIPTGSLMIDFLIGGEKNRFGFSPCPGIPKGKITSLYGENSTGKTTLALMAAAACCRGGGRVVYLDWENEVSPTYASALGCPDDEDYFQIYAPETLEQGIATILMIAGKNAADLIIIDSVGAAIPGDLQKQSLEDVGNEIRMGKVAATWSKYLPKIKRALAKSQLTVLAISQLRSTIKTGFGAKNGPTSSAQGGKAWQFFASLAIKLTRLSSVKAKEFSVASAKKEDLVVGDQVLVTLEKCKVSSSQRKSIKIYLRSGDGIDNIRSMAEVGALYGVVKKSGSTFTYESSSGEIITAVGIEAFRKRLKRNPIVCGEMQDRVFAVMREGGENGDDGVDEEEVPLFGEDDEDLTEDLQELVGEEEEEEGLDDGFEEGEEVGE